MTQTDAFKEALVETLPGLRAFAHLLARNHATADDLVQDTIVRAIACRHQFTPGTYLKGWLFTIMRNRFINLMRSDAKTADITAFDLEGLLSTSGGQDAAIEMRDLKAALQQLSVPNREAVILIAASYSYEEAAEILNCAVGTVKSCVSRSRCELTKKLRGVERLSTGRQMFHAG